jgi:hypothetical protein
MQHGSKDRSPSSRFAVSEACIRQGARFIAKAKVIKCGGTQRANATVTRPAYRRRFALSQR